MARKSNAPARCDLRSLLDDGALPGGTQCCIGRAAFYVDRRERPIYTTSTPSDPAPSHKHPAMAERSGGFGIAGQPSPSVKDGDGRVMIIAEQAETCFFESQAPKRFVLELASFWRIEIDSSFKLFSRPQAALQVDVSIYSSSRDPRAFPEIPEIVEHLISRGKTSEVESNPGVKSQQGIEHRRYKLTSKGLQVQSGADAAANQKTPTPGRRRSGNYILPFTTHNVVAQVLPKPPAKKSSRRNQELLSRGTMRLCGLRRNFGPVEDEL
ncbi:hypothetical protein B0H16DRAFT_1685956 [Mycena metata]|uniref:Uncharacterized protein n=1 Tax=Mycena metata TaxID=1033252 RepID=A0AAD7JUE9_9AGAR|nr:hypothetical protein B0H16DRAFT_1685956 [Mycena metata]